ncbi:hypothetical protein ACFX2K_033438 [Malus domestica]
MVQTDPMAHLYSAPKPKTYGPINFLAHQALIPGRQVVFFQRAHHLRLSPSSPRSSLQVPTSGSHAIDSTGHCFFLARLLSASIDCPSSPPSSRRRKAAVPPHKTHEPESHFEQAPEQEEFPDDDRLEETPPEPPQRRGSLGRRLGL